MKPTSNAANGSPPPVQTPLSPPPWKARLRSRLWRTLRLLALVYITLIVWFAFDQERLIFPGRVSQGKPDASVSTPGGMELVTLTTSRGDKIKALFAPAVAISDKEGIKPLADAAQRPTVLYFYGNGTWLHQMMPFLLDPKGLRSLGTNLLIPEYPGYGVSEGSASEANCYAAADAAYTYLLSRKDVDPKKIVLVGWSLGGAVAIDLAARRPALGLATLSTFTSVYDVATTRFPSFPLENQLLRNRFESKAKIARIACPIFLAHGGKDKIIPPTMRDTLAAAATAPVTKFDVLNATHVDMIDLGGAAGLDRLRAFIFALR